MSNFNIPKDYFQSNPEITAVLIQHAQEAINKSADPERYVVNVSTDNKGRSTVTIQDRNPDAVFNEAMTGNLTKMRGY